MEQSTDEFSGQLAAALRKSWSEPQETMFWSNEDDSQLDKESPISTPLNNDDDKNLLYQDDNLASIENANLNTSFGSTINDQQKHIHFNDNDNNKTTDNTAPDFSNVYQIFKRHYSLTDEMSDSISDILTNLNLETSVNGQQLPISLPQDIQQSQQQQQIEFLDPLSDSARELVDPFANYSNKESSDPLLPPNKTSKENTIDDNNNNNIQISPTTISNEYFPPNGRNSVTPGFDLNKSPEAIAMNKSTSHSANLRRGSINEVQRIRYLLNPRSSFSGASSNEPVINIVSGSISPFSALESTRSNNNSTPTPTSSVIPNLKPDTNELNLVGSKLTVTPNFNKCWITILVKNDPDLLRQIIVLNQSLISSNSQFPLVVLHTASIDITLLRKLNIKTLKVEDHFQNNINDTIQLDQNWSKLILFTSLIEIFDIVCYLSPSCIIKSNIDELLTSNEICDEIDNETCVLLTNNSTVTNNDLMLVILRPNKDISMCIREFFTVYDTDLNTKRERKNSYYDLSDINILERLFGDSWGRLSDENFTLILNPNNIQENDLIIQQCKILDFKLLKPWTTHNISEYEENGAHGILQNWYHLYNAATKDIIPVQPTNFDTTENMEIEEDE